MGALACSLAAPRGRYGGLARCTVWVLRSLAALRGRYGGLARHTAWALPPVVYERYSALAPQPGGCYGGRLGLESSTHTGENKLKYNWKKYIIDDKKYIMTGVPPAVEIVCKPKE